MNGPCWPQPIVATSDRSAKALVRQLWLRAERVHAAVADGDRLLDIAGDLDTVPGLRSVRVVSGTRPPVFAAVRWHWTTVVQHPLGSDFILFYTNGGNFPESALIFTGGIGANGWVTFHQRPLVLHRLRSRFDALCDEWRPHFASTVPSVREGPTNKTTSETAHRGRTGAETRAVTPSELYLGVLGAHFRRPLPESDESQRPLHAPSLAVHQERAYERACGILERFGGVIIADAVGLGKTYVGLRLLEDALQRGERCLVIVPAALREQWMREMSYIAPHAVSDPGKPETSAANRADDNLEFWVREGHGGSVSLLSLESLGRRSFDSDTHRGADLVLVDEAHNFRNPSTRRYRNLADIARHAKLVLLTATPINNTLLDLQHLIELFAAPGDFRHLGVPDYRAAFRDALRDANDMQPIISACVLRRTRRFLRDHYGTTRIEDARSGGTVELRFPARRTPVAVSYDLAGIYGALFAELEDWLDSLHFPVIESPTDAPDSGDSAGSPGALLKIILLKRLESSIEAFRRTIIQQLAWCNTALRAIDAGRVLTRPDYRASFRGAADDPGGQLALFELMLPAPSLEPGTLDVFRRFLEHDLQILTSIHRTLDSRSSGGDLKLEQLCGLLDGPLAGRKVIVFTEFRDTARYIHHRLKHRPHIAQVDSESARLGLERAARREVIERFAPQSNGLADPPKRERVDLLIATDVLSEGLNLQDASVVISYDLPWNPVKLMQRIGRIDRLGAREPVIDLYHFVPTRALDRLLGLMSRLQSKVATIGTALGLDHPVLGTPENRQPSTEQIRTLVNDPDGIEQLEADVEGPMDPEEQAYIDFASSPKAEMPRESSRPIVSIVAAAGLAAPKAAAYWVLDTRPATRALWLICDLETGCVTEDQAVALELFRSASSGERRRGHGRLLANARRACNRYVDTVVARLEAARIAGDALRPGLPQCRIAAWLSKSFRARAYRLTHTQKAQIDRLLERLARRFTPAKERELSGVAERLPAEFDPDLLAALDDCLSSFDAAAYGKIVVREVATLLLLPADVGLSHR